MKIVIANQFKNESLRLVEWLEYYRDRGITEFILCNDNSTDDSIEKIKSVKGINCRIVDSLFPPSHFQSSRDTDAYSGNCSVVTSISTNFQRIYRLVANTYGKETILGFFDVDEFIVGKTRNLQNEITGSVSGYLVTSLWSFEIDSDMFDVVPNKSILQQTTRTMSTKNRSLCTRDKGCKSFINLSEDRNSVLCSADPSLCEGHIIHTGGVSPAIWNTVFGIIRPNDHPMNQNNIPVKDSQEWTSPFRNWKLVAPETLKFLHYRKPTYDHSKNKNLFDVDCVIP